MLVVIVKLFCFVICSRKLSLYVAPKHKGGKKTLQATVSKSRRKAARVTRYFKLLL